MAYYELLATCHGLHFWPLGASIKSLLQSVEGRVVLESGRNIFKGLWHLNRLIQPLAAPFFAEQSFWGRWVAALGVGPAPILRHHLTAQRLANAIETALRVPEISAGAARLIRAEDGVARAVEIIQQQLG